LRLAEGMKRSLLTILMDASPADIRLAAETWDVPLTKRTHADNVALLFQAMTDRWVLEDVLDVLPPLAREVAGALALASEDGLTREDLMTRMSADPLDLNEALALLRRAEIMHRQSTGALYLPREIGTLITRSMRERRREEIVAPTIDELMHALDADVLLDAARWWHVADTPRSVRPGDRERLLHALRGRVTTPRALLDVEAALSPGARRVVAALREEAVPIALDDAAELANAGTPTERRALLVELTTSLIAMHTWAWGERVLVMPVEFRAPAMTQMPLPPLNAVSAESVRGWHSPYALAWDVLTLLRIVDQQGARWRSAGLHTLAEDYALADRVAPQFWATAGTDVPPTVVLAFYAALARARGLVTEREEDGARIVALHDPMTWARQTFATQTQELFAAWRGMTGWTEGQKTAVQLWGVDWPGFRARLLDALTACQPGHWYALENLLARLAHVRPSLLGETFTASSAVGQTPPDRDALTRACTETTLRTALAWFGVVAWGRMNEVEAVQVTEVGWWLLDRGREPAVPPFGATPLAIQPDMTALVLHPEPAHLWPLLALAEVQTLDRVSAYRITAASLRRALRRGLAFEQVIRFLESRTGGPLPEAIRATLDDWVRAVRRVVLERSVILVADDGGITEDILLHLRFLGAAIQPMPDGALLIRVPEGDDALAQWLKELDLTVVWKPGR